MFEDLLNSMIDFEKINALKERAESGDSDAQCELADMYLDGFGMDQDYAEAMKWYRKAAEQNNPTGMYNLGAMYYNGEGVEEDWEEAFKWYEKAASYDLPIAVRQLAGMYISGDGCEADSEKAIELYKKAADLGDAGAMLSIAKCYLKGLFGFELDLEKASHWLLKANVRAGETGCDWVQEEVKEILTPGEYDDEDEDFDDDDDFEEEEQQKHLEPNIKNSYSGAVYVQQLGRAVFYGTALEVAILPEGLTAMQTQQACNFFQNYVK